MIWMILKLPSPNKSASTGAVNQRHTGNLVALVIKENVSGITLLSPSTSYRPDGITKVKIPTQTITPSRIEHTVIKFLRPNFRSEFNSFSFVLIFVFFLVLYIIAYLEVKHNQKQQQLDNQCRLRWRKFGFYREKSILQGVQNAFCRC